MESPRKKDVASMLWSALSVLDAARGTGAETWDNNEWHKRGVPTNLGTAHMPDDRTIRIRAGDDIFEITVTKPRSLN